MTIQNNTLQVKNVQFNNCLYFPLYGNVRDIVDRYHNTFRFGKCYCINSKLMHGSWGISWIIAGQAKQDEGEILLNGKKMNIKQRQAISQCVGMNDNNYFLNNRISISKQIEKGLKFHKNYNKVEFDKIINLFQLSIEKVNRNMNSVSAMRFKASMAIGYSFKRSIYCFPWMENESLVTMKDIWIKDLVNVLKSQGYLVLIPTEYIENLSDLFDEVVSSTTDWAKINGTL